MRSAIGGIISVIPNASRTTIATVRTRSAGSPSASITYASPTIANVNVVARPITTPSGRRLPPVTPADSTAGRIGSTHGDSAVPAPAMNANTANSSIATTVPEQR